MDVVRVVALKGRLGPWGDNEGETLECAACGSFTFADESWEPERCANCLADLEEYCEFCHRPVGDCDCDEVSS